MHCIRRRVIAALSAAMLHTLAMWIPPAAAAQRYFELINGARDSVVSLEIAPAGSDGYRSLALGPRLQGGGNAVTLLLPAGSCLADLRISFRDGARLLYRDVDTCRQRGLRLDARDRLRAAQDTGTAMQARALRDTPE